MEELQKLRVALIRRSALEAELAEAEARVKPLRQELRELLLAIHDSANGKA